MFGGVLFDCVCVCVCVCVCFFCVFFVVFLSQLLLGPSCYGVVVFFFQAKILILRNRFPLIEPLNRK